MLALAPLVALLALAVAALAGLAWARSYWSALGRAYCTYSGAGRPGLHRGAGRERPAYRCAWVGLAPCSCKRTEVLFEYGGCVASVQTKESESLPPGEGGGGVKRPPKPGLRRLVEQAGDEMHHHATAGGVELLHHVADHGDQAVALARALDNQHLVRAGLEHLGDGAKLLARVGDRLQAIQLVDEVLALFERGNLALED